MGRIFSQSKSDWKVFLVNQNLTEKLRKITPVSFEDFLTPAKQQYSQKGVSETDPFEDFCKKRRLSSTLENLE